MTNPSGTNGITSRPASAAGLRGWGWWPGKGPQAPIEHLPSRKIPCRLLGKALSEFLESISRTQHRTILPMPPDQHHADGQSSGKDEEDEEDEEDDEEDETREPAVRQLLENRTRTNKQDLYPLQRRGAPLNLVDLAMRSSGHDMWLLDGPRRAGRGRAAFTDCHPRRQTRLLSGDLQPAQTRRLVPPLPAIDAPGRDSHGRPWGRLPFWQRARIGAPFS